MSTMPCPSSVHFAPSLISDTGSVFYAYFATSATHLTMVFSMVTPAVAPYTAGVIQIGPTVLTLVALPPELSLHLAQDPSLGVASVSLSCRFLPPRQSIDQLVLLLARPFGFGDYSESFLFLRLLLH